MFNKKTEDIFPNVSKWVNKIEILLELCYDTNVIQVLTINRKQIFANWRKECKSSFKGRNCVI